MAGKATSDSVIGHYRILGMLGRGGNAVVYKAEDLRLGRIVALKTLPDDSFSDGDKRERFFREARAVAALDHPHICTLYEILDVEGKLYLAMNYVSGGSLADRIHKRTMGVSDAVSIAIQIAEGLEEAHQHGIVHRDVKPANILLSESNQVKVADFGLAFDKYSQSRLTREGMKVGTPAFMSPEQWLGERVDARTDVWGLGIVLYMMLAGRAPFVAEKGRSVGHVILHSEPAPVSSVRRKVPAEFDRTLSRLLAKDKRERAASMTAVLDLLRPLQKSPTRTPSDTGQTMTMAEPPSPVMGSRSRVSVAVLPFSCRKGDRASDYFSEGLSEELISELSKAPSLRVVSRTSCFQFRGAKVDPIEVGKKLGVSRLVGGSVRRAGGRLWMSVELIDTADGSVRWSRVYRRESKALFEVQGEILRSIGEALQLQLEIDSHSKAGGDLQAYGLFLLGLQHLCRRTEQDLRNAVEVLTRAIRIDPTMAAAHSRLSIAKALLVLYGYDEPHLCMPAVAEAARAALAIDARQSDALVALSFVAFYYEWDPVEAERLLKSALSIAPSNSVAYNWYAVILLNLGRLGEAERYLREARSLDPISLPIQHNVVWLRILEGRFEEAVAFCRQIMRSDPTYRRIGYFLSWAYAGLGKWELAANAVREMAAVENIPDMAQLGCCYAALGDRPGAQGILDRLSEMAKTRYVSPMEPCYIHTALGQWEEAFACLEAAARGRAPTLLFFQNDSRLEPLRHDARFSASVPRLKECKESD